MTTHADLLARHRAVLPDWLALYYEHPIALVDGQGRRVRDAEGNTYLDFFGGILTTMTGYNVPEVVEAVREQAGRMLHTSTLYLIEQQIELAEQIARLAPMPDAKVFFGTSGTDATETALLLATSHRRSNQVLALRGSYHGRGFAAMGVTGIRGWSASSLSPVQVQYVPGADHYRNRLRGLSDADYNRAAADDLREIIETATAGDVACLIAEPIQGVGGFATPPDGYLGALADVCREYGILFVADEVQTGWGRTGEHFWGIEAHGVTPDLLTFAKGLGNGLAIGGVVGRADVVDGLPANSISTFGGNPLACAGALANLRYLLDHDLQGNARARGEQLARLLREGTDGSAIVGDIRGKGLMVGVELIEPGSGVPGRPSPRAASIVMEETKAGGLLVGKGGRYGNTLRVAPPLSVTADEIDEGAHVLVKAIEAAAAALGQERG